MANSLLFPPHGPDPRQQGQWLATDVEPHEEWSEALRDGTVVRIRPIGKDDVDLERRFIEELSPESRRFRFLGEIRTPSPQLLHQLTHPERTEAAFIAVLNEGENEKEIGVSRFSARNDQMNCEFAVAVADEWHNKGLASLLMTHLISTARRRGIECMYAVAASGNHAMHELAKHLGFQSEPNPNDATEVIYTLDLRAPTV